MITFHTAKEQKNLLNQFAEELKQNQISIFRPVHLISSGFLQDLWLKEGLAERNGILANLKTYRPDRFLEWVSFRLSGKQGIEQFTLQQLEWIYFSIMGERNFRDRFFELDEYYGNDQVKRFALAQKAVRLLDKYQDFRSELILQWRENNNLDSIDWQEYLFVRVCNDQAEQIPDKSVWPSTIRNLLREPNSVALIQAQIPVLYVFGSFPLSPKFLEVIQILGQFIQIHWYRVDMGIQQGSHRIAQNWGETMHKAQLALSEKFEVSDFKTPDQTINSSNKNTILAKAQVALSSNQELSISRQELSEDESIEFHSCHTKIREVESLYNYLIRILDHNKDLGARDIIVFVPQLDQYIAPIRTVFDTAPASLPYRIISKGYAQEESFWSAMVQLMKFDQDQFTAIKIMELIESKPIQEQFGFKDLELIRKMMSEANMARESEGSIDTETRLYSIHYGIKRLMYGFLLGKNHYCYQDVENEDVYTVDAVEGQQVNDLFRLLDLVTKLDQLVIEKQSPKTLSSWLEWIAATAENFLEPDIQTSKNFQRLLQDFGVVGKQILEKITFETFSFRFSGLMEEMDKHAVEGFGGIIFSELLPGRVLPKKVISMMGMNFGQFPRTTQELSFDKMLHGEKEPLDPNPRALDQGVFLEAFLAAEFSLYISFIGKSEQDNKTIPASTVVEELMDWVASAAEIKVEDLLITHPLHSSSVKYNQAGQFKLRNYLIKQDQEFDFGNTNDTNDETLIQIQLWQLQSFLKDSFKDYYNNVLGIYYGDQKHQLADKEPFDSDNLMKWQVKSQLLEAVDLPDEKTRKKFILQGLLPLRTCGNVILEEAELDIKDLKGKYQIHLPLQKSKGMLSISGHELYGEVTQTKNGELIFATVSKDQTKYRIEAALKYMFGIASGLDKSFAYMTNNIQLDWDKKISQEEATEKLEQIVTLFLEHRNKKFLYTHEIEFKKALDMGDGVEQIVTAREEINIHMKNLGGGYSFLSDYTLKDYKAGLFDDDESIRQMLQNIRRVNEILQPFLS